MKCLTNFDEMLAVVCLDGEGEVIFVTVSTFVLQILYGIWKEGGLYFLNEFNSSDSEVNSCFDNVVLTQVILNLNKNLKCSIFQC